MNKEIFDKIVSKEYLLIITDEKGNILFKTNNSPVSQFFTSYYNNEINLENKKLIIYANQLGLALTALIKLEHVNEYISYIISEPSEKILLENNIKYQYKNKIKLIKSSKDNSKVCSIEKSLSKLENINDKIKFLEETFKSNIK